MIMKEQQIKEKQMVIAPDNYLIPYPGHHYPVQPYIQDHSIANHQHQQAAIEEQKSLRRSASGINVHGRPSNDAGSLYNFKLFLQNPAFEQVGSLVDIYA